MIAFIASLFVAGVTVTLPPEAHVRGAELELRAIAQVEGDDPLEVERVAALRLGYAPAPGFSRLLLAERVQEELQRLAPAVAIQVRGALGCRVWPQTEEIGGAALETAARTELERALGARDATFRLRQPSAPLVVPAGIEPHELRSILEASALKSGALAVPVRVLVDGSVYRTVWTNWDVELWEELTVLKAPLRSGETIASEMLARERVLVTAARTLAGSRPLSEAKLAGTVAARDLPAGTPLVEADVLRPSLVKRGDTLFLEIRKGAISARVAAVAQDEGAVGDTVRVSLLDGAREMQAVVLARDLVRIDLTPQR